MPKGSIPRSRMGKVKDFLLNRSDISRAIREAGQFIKSPPSLTGPINDADVARSFNLASMFAGGGGMFRRPSGSIGTGGRQYKVAGASPKTKVTQPKPGTSKFIGPVKPKTVNKTKAQAVSSSSSSSSSPSSPRYKVAGAQKTYTGPKPKAGDKKFIGPTRPLQPGEKGFIGPTRPTPTSSGPKKRGYSVNTTAAVAAGSAAIGGVGGAVLGSYSYNAGNTPNKGGNPKTVNPYVTRGPNRGLSQRKQTASGPIMPKVSMAGGGVNKPSSKASDFKEKNLKANQAAGKTAAQKSASSSTPEKKSSFKGNWKGAAPYKKPSSLQEATRRNLSDEYTREKVKSKLKPLFGRKKGK